MRRALKALVASALGAALLWALGLLAFVAQIPKEPESNPTPTDAIVVLTGSAGRIEAGFALWSQGRAKKLFISGAGEGVNVAEIYHLAGRDVPAASDKAEPETRVVLGYEATDTRGNAREVAQWMKKEGFVTARLVTANYHLPRSLMEMRESIPDAGFIPEPVFSANVRMEQWWRYPGTRRLVLLEYHKTLASWLEHRLSALAGLQARSPLGGERKFQGSLGSRRNFVGGKDTTSFTPHRRLFASLRVADSPPRGE